jgi:23S rRNA (uracil1939-C5)-methyltransferase
MASRKLRNTIIENITISGLAAEGKALVRHENRVIFLPGNMVAPGDVIDAKIIKQRKNYLEAIPVHFHHKSEQRVEPFCEHFGVCGGCKWQHLPYELQLAQKQQQVEDNLTRIAQIQLPEIQPILPSANTQYYRNKLEYTFSTQRWRTAEEIQSEETFDTEPALGFHIPGRFDKILDIHQCHLQANPSNAIRLAVKKYAIEHELPFFELREQHGFLRNLVIRTSTTGDLMVILIIAKDNKKLRIGLLDFLQQEFPQITSLYYIVNSKKNDSYQDLEPTLYVGKPYIEEEMEGLRFRIGAKSFYQTNSLQAYQLYKVTRDFAQLKGSELVYDLYTGTGTIANFIAKQAKKVIGLEYVEAAIEDAKVNSSINEIKNTEFYAGDMKDVLTASFFEKHGRPEVIITDPPRAGMHEDVISVILEANPERIVYVSCNPATQARDLALLDAQYKVTALQPVDMFPHTHHVENVAALVRK